MKLNVEKMRRHMARQTPDAIWRTFDLLDSDRFNYEYELWKNQWARMIKIKYKGQHIIMNVSESSLYDQPGKTRIQLVAVVNGVSSKARKL